jgi:O-antigen/teichoic acid export membrane protein
MSIVARILKVGAAKSIEMVIVTIVRFFSVPLFLHAWSTEMYGEWLILYSLLAYFSLGNLGFAQAAANEMTMFVARGEREKALVTYQSTFVAITAISVMLIGLAAVVAWVLPIERWMSLQFIGGNDLRLIVLLFVAYVVVAFFMGLFMAGYRCEGKYHRGIFYSNAAIIVEFAILALVLLMGKGPLPAAFSMLAVKVVAVLVVMVDIKFVVPWLCVGSSHAQKAELRRILGPSLSFVAMPAGQTFIGQGAIIGIGVIVGPVAVVLFSSLRTLTNLVTRLFDLVNQAFYPEVSMAWGAGNKELLRKLHRVSCQASFWLGLIAVAGLAFFGPWVFGKWTQGKVALDLPLFWGFLGLVLLRSSWYTSFVMPSAINKHQKLTAIYLIVSVFGLAFGISAISIDYRLVIAGFAIIEIAMIATTLRESLKYTNDRIRKFAPFIVRPPNPFIVRERHLH